MNLRLFGKNTAIYAIGNVGLRLASFLLIPLYTNSLSIAEYGLLVILLLMIQMMVIFMNLGAQACVVRYAKEYEALNLISCLLGTSILINVAGAVMVTIVSISFLTPFLRLLLHTDYVRSYLLLTCFAAFAQSLCTNITSYYRAQNESIKFMFVGIVSAIILIILNLVLLLVFHQGIKGALTAVIATHCVMFLCVSFDVFSKTGISSSFQIVPKLLKFGFPLVFSLSGRYVMGTVGIYFLSVLKGIEVVAIFALGWKLAQVVEIAVVLPFQLAYAPFVFANIDKSGIKVTMARLLTYLVLAIAFVSFATLFASRALLPLIAPAEYSSAYLVIVLLIPAIAFKAVSFFGEVFLHVTGDTRVVGSIIALSAVLCAILSYTFISEFGWHGAIISINVSYMAAALTTMLLGIKAFPIQLEWRRLSIASGLFALCILLYAWIHDWSDASFYTIALIAVSLGVGVVYLGILRDGEERATVKGIVHAISSRVVL